MYIGDKRVKNIYVGVDKYIRLNEIGQKLSLLCIVNGVIIFILGILRLIMANPQHELSFLLTIILIILDIIEIGAMIGLVIVMKKINNIGGIYYEEW